MGAGFAVNTGSEPGRVRHPLTISHHHSCPGRCAVPKWRVRPGRRLSKAARARSDGQDMKAIIIGGGIGGLTTALMLHARGIDCEVFEQADAIRELGVGINTLPHAIKELAALGLLERLDAVAIRTHELFYMNRFGQEIWREPRGIDAGYDVPQFSIHRGRLHGVIHQAVRARIGEGRITPAIGSARLRRTKAASPPISSTAPATAPPRAATC